MADVGLLDYLGYAALPNMMRMAQARQDEIDKARLGAFLDHGRSFDTGGAASPNGIAIEHSGGAGQSAETPQPVRESWERLAGGLPMPSGRMRGTEELRLRDMATEGRGVGMKAGEAAITGARYAPQINDARLGEIARVLEQTGESPMNYDLAGTVTGAKRMEAKDADNPKNLEALATRQMLSGNYDAADMTLKRLKELKAREHAPLAFNIDEQLWKASNGDPSKWAGWKAATHPRTTGETPEDKDLKRLEDDIMQVAGRLASIKSGQNMMDTAMSSERPEVVQQLTSQLNGMVQEYQRRGGNPQRLGVQPGGQQQASPFKSPDDVKAAYKSGKITRDKAAEILRTQFGMQ
jgi:hypothetical protein